MIIALSILGGLVALLLFALLVPVELAVDLKVPGDRRVRIRWFFISKEIRKGGKEGKPKALKKGKKRKAWRDRIEIDPLVRLGLRVLRCIRVPLLQARLQFGLADPAETGILFGRVGPLVVPWTDRVRIEPCFEGEMLEVSAHGRFRVTPADLLWEGTRFVFTGPGFRLVRALVFGR